MKTRTTRSTVVAAGIVLAMLGLMSAVPGVATADDSREVASSPWIVGTWYLTLDTTVFGLPPGLPFSGLAIFNNDGTFQFQDAGDFGPSSFFNRVDSQQFGSWRHGPGGTIITTALFLEADRLTGEVLHWERTEAVLHRTDDRNIVAGEIDALVLDCQSMPPFPTPVTCPDPIESADEFVLVPPADIPIMLKRLVPR